ncbi:MAG: MFS transporter [Galbitalea sp.]
MSTAVVSPTPSRLSAPEIFRWRNALFVIFAACGISISSFAARIPTISLALSLSTGEVGLLLSAMALGSIVGLLAAGHIVSIFGARRTVVVAFSLLATSLTVAGLGIALFGSFALSFTALIVLGSTMGICDVSMNISGAANEQALGRTVMPVYHAFFSIGTVIGAGLGALAEALHIPLDIHVTVLAVLTFTGVLLASRFLLSEQGPTTAGEPGHPASTWRHPTRHLA